jgi:hypothetical protein
MRQIVLSYRGSKVQLDVSVNDLPVLADLMDIDVIRAGLCTHAAPILEFSFYEAFFSGT